MDSRFTMATALLASVLALVGCHGKKTAPARPPATHASAKRTAVSAEGADDDSEDDDGNTGLDPTPPVVHDVDHMTEPELQTACFHGSTIACDRLGH